jgi:hypothetical protein
MDRIRGHHPLGGTTILGNEDYFVSSFLKLVLPSEWLEGRKFTELVNYPIM